VWLIVPLLLLGVFLQSEARAFTINVVQESPPGSGNFVPIHAGFRYLIEEDNSYYVIPSIPTPQSAWTPGMTPTQESLSGNTLAVNIHKSHAPVVCAGDTGAFGTVASVNTSTNPACVIDPTKHYTVSVIPWHTYGAPTTFWWPNPNPNGPWFANQAGWGMNGRCVAGSDSSVTVVVNQFPNPTAQVTVLVFQDTQPINGAYDQPAETGLGGFNIYLNDILGKVMQDAWGNPIGTTYKVNRSSTPLANGYYPPIKSANGTYSFILQANGLPTPDFIGNGHLTSCSGHNPPLTDYEKANCVDLDTGAPLAAGEAVIRFLPPNKYPIEIIPPAQDPNWILTSTLEGTRTNDAWVRYGEPRFNIVNGQLNWLCFYGFVKTMPMTLNVPQGPTCASASGCPGTGAITGRVVVVHDMHPPISPGLTSGAPAPNCYVGLNNLSGNDEQVYTAPCDNNSRFNITKVPPGLYQLVMWDKEINQIIDFRQVTVNSTAANPLGDVQALGDVAVFSWFGILKGSVFNDTNGNGTLTTASLPGAGGKPGIANMRVSARFTDGSMYQSQLTDSNGNYKFTQFFPWWRWMVVESDQGVIGRNYGRFKPTGMTAIVDQGGSLTGSPYAADGITPLPQGGLNYRVDTVNTMTQDMMLFQDMTNVLNWGKVPYGTHENGGVSGFISYATSRTQENPEKSFWQSWEPGVPNVRVDLYQAVQACSTSGKVCTNNPAACTASETCNWVPATCTVATVNGDPTLTACTKAAVPAPVSSTYTSSYDKKPPTGCVEPASLNTGAATYPIGQIPGFNSAGQQLANPKVDANGNVIQGSGIVIRDCAETFRTWNQVRPGIYDGNYNFPGTLPVGSYIVKATPPTGYKILKYGERNIEFGEPTAPFQAYPPACVGPAYAVPKFHQLFPDWQIPTMYPGFTDSPTGPQSTWYCNAPGVVNPLGYCTVGGVPTLNPAIGPVANDCTMKQTAMLQGETTIVDFRIFTDVPKSSKMWGWVSDDLHLESNPYSINASSNFAPSHIPVALQDWMGRTVWRGYTDQWGKFEGNAPSTYYIYAPNPIGMSAQLYTVQVNNPGPIVDQSWTTGIPRVCDGTQVCNGTVGDMSCCVTDPFFNPAYGQETIRENWDFYAGLTVFIDTIVIPDAAVISNIPANCDFVDHTPEIAQVDSAGMGPIVSTGASIHITSLGTVQEPNPDWNPLLPSSPSNPATIPIDHGFGAKNAQSKVTVTGANGVVHALTITGWTNTVINATVPAGVPTGQLTVTRSNPNPNTPKPATLSSTTAVTLHVNFTGKVTLVQPPPSRCDPYTDATQCQRIQPAINAAAPGDIISIAPTGPGGGKQYMENPILYKPVTLQGWGAGTTILDGTAALANLPGKDAWNTLFQGLVGATCSASTDCISITPGQVNDFTFEQGAGIMVAACDFTTTTCHNDFSKFPSMIDGLTLRGASEAGGGIYVNSYARGLHVTNNMIYANQGNLGGGVRIGSPSLVNGTVYTDSHNENMVVAHNLIYQNGSLTSGGGGLAIYKGADSYQVTNNMICGNFSNVYGGGIGHFGLSPNGYIGHNVIVSNESFDEGGGVHCSGELPIAGVTGIPGTISEGAGSVTIERNLIQGNKGGDDGGGLRTLMFNGQDIANNKTDPTKWSTFTVTNNMIVDNSSGDHGGGIALDDTVFSYIIGNQIARNVSTATGSGAFTNGQCVEGEPIGQFCPPPGENIGGIFPSTPRVGGIASYYHSTALAAVLASIPTSTSLPAKLKTYANPYLYDDIIWQNHSYYWDAAANSGFGGLLPAPPNYHYWDLAVYGRTAVPNNTPTGDLFYVYYSMLTLKDGTYATSAAGIYHNRAGVNPGFVKSYYNKYQASSKGAAFGNFVNVYFTPVGLMNSLDQLYGDYHIKAADGGGTKSFSLPPAGRPTPANLLTLVGLDYDGQARPATPDAGADQHMATETWFPF
jgi:hypothetical protein